VAKSKLSYSDAVRLVGESRLKRAGRGSAISNWKVRGVPWSVAGPLLLTRLRGAPAALDDAPAEIQALEVHLRMILAPLLPLLPAARRTAVLRHLLTQVSLLADVLRDCYGQRADEPPTIRAPHSHSEEA